ncbi:tRNA (adenosine(37)-N6)-threonylcarbamoyltransferase complex ATPase subunit type 1 TsaE [Mesomycoplasma ovipneumoniae]|uniref:tRNA threonylcarbamoyladenosine biosynthesis protein TsaE n=1 Tax=Mesomycoplasma ovipneumoniae TaxID=29562 RepID=A0AAJ2P6Q1_9BACT|nr:tRNA (adenosine(37)-N6)-threonylcarbamoyltransferase complex ATPase subunit type 1 TsaE [Mesomycoplasma ovipneumoniae]MDW2829709.1 tRNA (adenosine(37)-N6)-threonylcarbamoyltransferase complex ATPase subunit type 1 TsaE [Mesomycoplasma ovipneumoniae]MDW2870664.1 tRNA (adenosine(37)-N6)-threonylcarbamoyltransferase complex ATPase subunit type 1 TsaE [Mesomycoplasma ovipneumoniae]MDW2893430.1 tRNA (adenosine(37)-N6)-threonylcarbamoyltransferase complex ATPase subunit type 1 TsaE [Mesomycoplasma 
MNLKHIAKNYHFCQQIISKTPIDLEIIFNLIISKKIQFIYLVGPYGSGKTDFTKKFARKIGIKHKIISPSFNFMFAYENLVHIDLDNFSSKLDEFQDYFEQNYVVIEWANKLDELSQNSILINFEIIDPDSRKIKFCWN